MELCSAFVQFSPNFRLRKHKLTPAEFVTLRAVHRDCEFTECNNKTTIERTDSMELQRLRALYGTVVVDRLFPGATPIIPTTFMDISLDVSDTPLPVEAPMTSMPTYEDAAELHA